MICRIGPTFVVVDSCTSASAWEHRFPLDFPDCPEWAGICCCCRLVRCGWLMLVEDVLQRSSGTFLVSTAWMMRSLGHPRCFPAHRSYEKKNIFKQGNWSCSSFLIQKSSRNPTGKLGPDLHDMQEISTQCGTILIILSSHWYNYP